MRTTDRPRAMTACARAMIAALALFALLLALSSAQATEADGMLRVRLARLGAPSELRLRVDCDYTLATDPSIRIPADTQARVQAQGGTLTLYVGDRSVTLGPQAQLLRDGEGAQGIVFTAPALSGRFCGGLNLAASGDAIAAVLDIYVEDYLYGVVGNEMAPSSGLEALKAQAVIARNYALMRKSARSNAAYDLSDSGDALSFRGYSDSREYADALRAVDETRGQVLTYNGSPAVCYFCDSNGGQTEASANAYDVSLPYSEVRDDPFDYEGTGAKKSATLRKDADDLAPELAQALYEGMFEVLVAQNLSGKPEDVAIAAIVDAALESPRFESPSRLYTTLALRLAVTGHTSQGDASTVEVTVRVPTYGALERWYDLSINDDDNETVWLEEDDRSFTITFRRSGSGVGMSRHGAQVMAREGFTCKEILDFYYPGTTLETIELTQAARDVADGASQVLDPIATARLSQKSRLYAKPDASLGALTTLPAGATVDVYAVQGEWAAVGSGTLQGFTHSEALTSFALVGVTAATVKNETLALVNAGPVDVLQLPVATATVLERLSAGATVRLDAYTDAWALIATAAGTEGFIPRDALTLQAADRAGDEGDTVTAPDDLYGLVTEAAGLFVNADDSIEPRRSLAEGDYVQILAYNSAWAYVRTEDDVKGYVKLSALSAVQRTHPQSEDGQDIEGGPITVVEGKQYCYIAADALSLFERYSTQSAVLATLRRGDKVQLGAYNEKWACVRVDGVTGFVLISGLSEADPDAGEDGPEGGEIIRVEGTLYAAVAQNGTPLYPTWDASTTPKLLLEKGAVVRIGAYNAVWACVRADGVTGFVRIDALRKAEP